MRISDWSSDVCSSDLFVWGRFRYDVVAILALLTALALGIVSPEEAFTGFSDDLVIIVGSALVLSGAVQRSGVIESAQALVSRRVQRVRRSEERRVGKECVSTFRFRGSP